MPDLVQKYFREDLTLEELQALENLLENSEDAAWRFGKAAEKAYYRYGLSKPRWPHTPNPPTGPKFGVKLWVSLSMLAIGSTMAWLFWKHPPILNLGIFKHFQVSNGSPKPGPTGKTAAPARPVDKTLKGSNTSGKAGFSPPAFRNEEPKSSEHPVSGSPAGTPEVATAAVPAASRIQPMVNPINLEEAPSRTFSSLSLRINQAELGYVTVQVLDMRGIVISTLYQGNLASGSWLFEWDGKLRNGQKASRGFYQIEVRSGSYSHRRNIEIR